VGGSQREGISGGKCFTKKEDADLAATTKPKKDHGWKGDDISRKNVATGKGHARSRQESAYIETGPPRSTDGKEHIGRKEKRTIEGEYCKKGERGRMSIWKGQDIVACGKEVSA